MKVAALGSCHSLNTGLSGWVSFMNLDYAQSLMNDLPILISSANGVPVYAHAGDAGCDLRSSHAAVIEPGERLKAFLLPFQPDMSGWCILEADSRQTTESWC